MYATKDDIQRLARAVVTPPRAPLPHRDYCRTLSIPDGPLRGSRYLPESDPVHDCLSREISAGWQRIIAVGAVQTGKSLSTVLVPLLRSLTILRQPCVYSQPTLTKLHEGWAGKLAPSMRDSGCGGWLPDKGQGSKGSQTPKFITLRDPKTNARAGTLYLIPGGGANESGQAAVTAQLVAVDEVDSFPNRHRVELVLKRADSYGAKALRILTSTVKADGEEGTPEGSIILSFYRESTGSRLWFRCPHCAKFQTIEWERVSYDDSDEPAAIASATYSCLHCAVSWTEDDRQRALRDWRCVHRGQSVDQEAGAVIGAAPLTVAFGLLWTALDSSLRQMGQVAAEHWRASRSAKSGDFGPMRSFTRDQLCRPYQEPAGIGEITNEGLAAVSSRSDYDKRIVPHWVTTMSGAVDVQGDRHYWLVQGHGPDDRACLIDWGYEMLVPKGQDRTPTPADRRRVLHEVDAKFNEGWQIEGGESRMSPLPGMRGIDVGYVTDEIVAWLRGVKGWRAVKGAGKDLIKNLGKILDLPAEARAFVEVRQPDGWPVPLIHILNDNVLRWCHAALLRDPYSPGSLMLPRGLKSGDMLCLHLSGEVETIDESGKAWVKEVRVRHDLGDCLKYATALSRFRAGLQTVQAQRPARKYGAIGQVRR